MNNGIMVMDNPLESHEDGRRIGDESIEETVMMCRCGSRALHEMRGSDNFGIIDVLDKCGDSRPQGTIKTMKVWCNDGQSRFDLEVSGEDFWFRNGAMCESFCGENGINPKHWKRTEEARTHKSRKSTNARNDQNNEEDRTERTHNVG